MSRKLELGIGEIPLPSVKQPVNVNEVHTLIYIIAYYFALRREFLQVFASVLLRCGANFIKGMSLQAKSANSSLVRPFRNFFQASFIRELLKKTSQTVLRWPRFPLRIVKFHGIIAI